jgi:uncharacterized protein HemY
MVMWALSLAENTRDRTAELWMWIGILAGAVVVLAAVLWLIRKKTLGDDQPVSGALAFTLSDLRQMHQAGQLSDEQFERLKARLINQTMDDGQSERTTDPPSAADDSNDSTNNA